MWLLFFLGQPPKKTVLFFKRRKYLVPSEFNISPIRLYPVYEFETLGNWTDGFACILNTIKEMLECVCEHEVFKRL